MAGMATMGGGGGDPRSSFAEAHNEGPIPPQSRALHDSSVSFEEYIYYAQKTREEERQALEYDPPTLGVMGLLFPTKSDSGVKSPVRLDNEVNIEGHQEKRLSTVEIVDANLAKRGTRAVVSDKEWTDASRALRTASWAACFYLITTDILGPFGIGFSMGTLGWGPGIGLFTVFGILGGYSGWLMWRNFLGIDSYEFPCKNYGDVAFRIYGRPFRHLVNFLQSTQLLLSVGVITIGNGLSISEVSKFKLCYAVCCAIWAIVGFGLGQVRTLQKFGFLANFAVFINLLIMFISMGVMAHSLPNYQVSAIFSAGGATNPALVTQNKDGSWPPVTHYSTMPPSPLGFIGAINGLMQGVYAYAGLQLFIEFMAELKRPRDFIKAMWGAQFFIYSCYMIYGCYVYYYQGQYANQTSFQGLSPYAWQTVCNILAVISGIIAAALYGNIGIKVIYNNIFMDFFNAPPLTTKNGKIIWAIFVPIYWTIAFIIAASVPDFFGLTSIVAAVCFTQFTYTFPAILGLGYTVKRHAMRADEGFDPATGQIIRHDSGMRRWIRGFFAGGMVWTLVNIFNIIYFFGALVVSGLGAYSAIKQLILAFQVPQINAFTCNSPLNIGQTIG